MKNYTIKLFYADWCGHCQKFKPEWNKFKEFVKNNSLIDKESKPITIATEEYSDDGDNKMEMEKEQVDGFPTIIIYKNNANRKIYDGSRDYLSLLKHLDVSNIPNAQHTQMGGANNYYYNKYLKYKQKYLELKNGY